MVKYSRYSSPLGEVYAASIAGYITDVGIRYGNAGFMGRLKSRYGREIRIHEELSAFCGLFKTFDRYFSGEPVEFNVAIKPIGTPFETRVWRVLKEIPRGTVRSYGWTAGRAGSPGGARAAGGACAKNPIPIIIPCHRVICSDGSIGGYTGGVDIKRELLRLEGYSGAESF